MSYYGFKFKTKSNEFKHTVLIVPNSSLEHYVPIFRMTFKLNRHTILNINKQSNNVFICCHTWDLSCEFWIMKDMVSYVIQINSITKCFDISSKYNQRILIRFDFPFLLNFLYEFQFIYVDVVFWVKDVLSNS